MKILVNAYNLRIGGGESVGIGIISALYSLSTENQYLILVNKKKGYERFSSNKNIRIHYVPDFFTHFWLGNLLSSFYLIYMVLKLNPAVIFSMGNYAIPVKRKQLLFLHWPYVVYPDSIAWQRQKGSSDYFKRKIRKWFIKKQLRFATAITVQTPLMKKQFLTYFSYPSNANVHVVESSVSEQIENESDNHLLNKIDALKAKHKDHVFLLCLSQYYTHKNIEVLEPLAEEIKKNNARFRIFINIDASQHHKADHFLKTIKAKKLDHIIIHIGHIPQNLLYKVYQRANGFILPTLLESFGIIYREAMIAGIPIFTSDLDFAHEACGDAAFYFAPLDHKSIYNTLINAYDNPVLIQNKIDCGKKKASGFLSWEEITKKYIEVIEQL